MYLCYITNMPFYESQFMKRLETMNECLLVCQIYHFVLFADIIWSADARLDFGLSALIFIIALLSINMLIILAVSIKKIVQVIRRKLQ